MGRILLALLLCLVAAGAFAQQRLRIDVGSVPALSSGPLYIAKEKGYFAAAGLDVEIQHFPSSSDMAALVATGRLPIIGGALSAGFFNSVEKQIPVKLILSRNTTPAYNILMLRADLVGTVKTAADLKGRTLALLARGSVINYQAGKILESGGLTLKDVEQKFMPFPQIAIAFQNKAIDAGIMIPPLSEIVAAQGIAVKFIDSDDAIKVHPVLVSVKQVNTNWAAANPKAVRDFIHADLRATRDYCNAYHHAPNRPEIVAILAKYTDVKDPAQIEKMEWGARDPYGRIFEESMMDIQDFFFKEGLIGKKFTPKDLADSTYLDEANKKLGPFTLAVSSQKRGCR